MYIVACKVRPSSKYMPWSVPLWRCVNSLDDATHFKEESVAHQLAKELSDGDRVKVMVKKSVPPRQVKRFHRVYVKRQKDKVFKPISILDMCRVDSLKDSTPFATLDEACSAVKQLEITEKMGVGALYEVRLK